MRITVKSMKPMISVIIPAFNEEAYIAGVLESLTEQTFKDFEVIVVDKESTDRTRDIAAKYGKVIIEKREGIGLARNTGVQAAKGKIIFFTNADTKLAKNALGVHAKAFKNKKLVAASGPLVPLEETTAFIRFGYRFASVWLAKLSFALGQPAIAGSNFAVRKDAFRKVGGFDTALETYEDLDLTLRLRKTGEIAYLNDAVVATSTRRIRKWGVLRYIYFNASNVIKYNFFKKSHGNYEYVR